MRRSWNALFLVLMIALMSALVPVLALAQSAPDAPEPIQWLKFAAMAVTGVLVPLAVELLRRYWDGVPAVVQQIASLVAGSLIMALTMWLSDKFGFTVDLSELAQFFATGGALGLATTIGVRKGIAQARAA